jgi:hypothetical protein
MKRYFTGCAQVRFPQARLGLAFGRTMAETLKRMAFAKFTWRRLGAALGFGMLLEGLLLVAMVFGVNILPHRTGDAAGDLLQSPASYLMPLLAKLQQPGFQEQVGYLLLIPLVQWPVYTVILYLWLSRSDSKRNAAAPPGNAAVPSGNKET